MATHTQIKKPGKGLFSKLLTCFTALFLLIVLYVLSAEPVARMFHVPGVTMSPALQTFYAPLIWVCEHNESANRARRWYVRHVWPN